MILESVRAESGIIPCGTWSSDYLLTHRSTYHNNTINKTARLHLSVLLTMDRQLVLHNFHAWRLELLLDSWLSITGDGLSTVILFTHCGIFNFLDPVFPFFFGAKRYCTKFSSETSE